jgi:gliding motility-associated-like protein
MKKLAISLFTTLLVFSVTAIKAQLRVGTEGIFLQKETVFFSEGLTLVPAADWSFKNLTVTKDYSVVIWPKYNSILRKYRFSSPVTFQGELAMNYTDLELNGNEAKDLVLAYSKLSSNNHQDFTLVKESVADPNSRSVGQLLTSPIMLSDLTAVSDESTSEAYRELEVNNMITPNGDGVNDTWVVKNINLYSNNEVKIFDREGRLVFAMNSYDNSWDGKFNGNPLPEDTYYYILSFDSGKMIKKGFITIVKKQ